MLYHYPFSSLGDGVFVNIDCRINTVLIEYTGDKIIEYEAEDKLDDYVAAEMGCYVLFVSEQDGPRLLNIFNHNQYIRYI